MSETTFVALLSLIGTLIGTLGGIVVSNRLTTFRIERLEEKVKQHNSIVERTYKLEGEMKAVKEEVQDLKKYHIPN